MTKEELEKTTGQELIDERDYCGVDGYYGDYLDNVNAEMLKRFNCLADIEKENAELKKDKSELCHSINEAGKAYCNAQKKAEKQLTKAKEIINTFLGFAEAFGYSPSMDKFISEAKQFLKEWE